MGQLDLNAGTLSDNGKIHILCLIVLKWSYFFVFWQEKVYAETQAFI